jgi:hypothetical protein
MNCDTCLAINLRAFNLNDADEFMFVLKNYDYVDSDYVYLFKARNSDMDENGEVLFKIPPRTSQMLKHGAFYNFAVAVDAYNRKSPTVYKRLTENGAILLEYGAQDALIETGFDSDYTEDTISARLATLDTVIEPVVDAQIGELLSGRLVTIEEA